MSNVDELEGSTPTKTSRKKVVYLDQFTLSHMASSQDPRFTANPALAVYKELYALAREAVHNDLVVFPRSQTHIEEIDLAEHSAEALTYVSHSLSWGIEFHLPERVRVEQLLRHVRAFVEDKPLAPFGWKEAFDADPHAPASTQSMAFMDGQILLAATRTVTSEARERKAAGRARIGAAYDAQRLRHLKAGVTFKQVVAFEAWGRIAHHFFFSGFSLDYLREYESRLTSGLAPPQALVDVVTSAAYSRAHGLLDAAIAKKIGGLQLFDFLTSFAALRVPFIDIEARLMAMLMTDKVRTVEAGDIDDINAVSIAAPYCDVVICDVRIADLLRRTNSQRSILEDYPHLRVFTGSLRAWNNFVTTCVRSSLRG